MSWSQECKSEVECDGPLQSPVAVPFGAAVTTSGGFAVESEDPSLVLRH